MTTSNWHLAVCGINHKTASISQRELIQLNRSEMAKAHATFSNLTGVIESTIVSTCNRVEFYFVFKRDHHPFDLVRKFYQRFKGTNVSGLEERFYTKKNKHAADNLFRVAAGIDSMVIGENQILGQMKDAYSSACAVRAAGKVIHRLFHQAFRVGKIARTDTEMGKGACSVSSAAVEMLKSRLNALNDPSILFIGINQMIALAASGLQKLDYGRFAFANRSPETAREFAAKYEASGFSLDDLPARLADSDVVITCTGSSTPILTRKMLDDLMASRPDKKLTIMDMAVPRDVEIENDYSPDIEVLNLEDIQRFVKNQQDKRLQAIPGVEEIIERKLGEFVYWFDHVRYEPVYNGLHDAYENIRKQVMATALEELPEDQRTTVNLVTRNLVNKLVQLKIRINGEPEEQE
ncbi:MAG: glutamyl-tRNA reductase [Candidatus Zixiibacteriota bacterium]|nr:MAG: glutamyl-tRNA reductase [candidate division Zixibacteria bacterium]